MDLHYNQYVTDTVNKNVTEYHLESPLRSKQKWDDILQLDLELMFLHKNKINSSTSIGNMLHRVAKQLHILLHLSVIES